MAVSADLAKTRPGMDPEGKRSILCDNDPTFMLYRIAQRYGLPVVPEWAGWFNEELRRHGAITPLVGIGCYPVLVRGTKKLFLNWIAKALRKNRIKFPEGNRPICWSLANSYFRVSEFGVEDESSHEVGNESPTIPAAQEGELRGSY